MEERQVAYKVADKYLKDKRTKELVKTKVVYADWDRISEGEKEIVQMYISSGYILKKWNSVRKEKGINAKMVLQYYTNKINAEKEGEAKNTLTKEKDKFLSDLKGSGNFMNILSDFTDKYAETVAKKKEIKALFISKEVDKQIEEIKYEKEKARITKAREERQKKKKQKEMEKEIEKV